MPINEKNIEAAWEIDNALSSGRHVKYLGQTILFRTHLYGKDYFWMRDGDGTHYLCRIGENGFPDLSQLQ